MTQQGKPFIWLGYAKYHKVGTYILYHMITGKIVLSRDVIFMRKTFHDYVKDNVLKEQEKCDDKNSLPKSMEDNNHGRDGDGNVIYAIMPMLVGDHGGDADKDEVEDPKLVQEENTRSE